MAGAPLTVSLKVQRPMRRVDEFTLFPDKVRVEWRKPFAAGTTEIPLRFLDPTWAAQKGMGPLRPLVFGSLMGLGGLVLLWAGQSVVGKSLSDGVPLLIFGSLLALSFPWAAWSWWNSRFDVIVFTSLHPQFGALVLHRTKAQELEILQFADTVSERIKLFALTKPEG